MIKQKIENILDNAFARYAKEYEVAETDLQIICSLNSEDSTRFQILKKFQTVVKEITIMELLDKKMDFTGMSALVPHFISQKLVAWSKELEIPKEDIKAIIAKGNGEYLVYIYNKGKYVKTNQMEDVTGDV
jgi:hypothetical protein